MDKNSKRSKKMTKKFISVKNTHYIRMVQMLINLEEYKKNRCIYIRRRRSGNECGDTGSGTYGDI